MAALGLTAALQVREVLLELLLHESDDSRASGGSYQLKRITETVINFSAQLHATFDSPNVLFSRFQRAFIIIQVNPAFLGMNLPVGDFWIYVFFPPENV